MKNLYVIGSVAFVPHPVAKGFWFRCDLSVVKAACPYPGCGSPVGVPCRSLRPMDGSYTSSTHYYRRDAAKRIELASGDTVTLTIQRTQRKSLRPRRR